MTKESPNLQQLIIHLVTIKAIPNGAGFAAGIEFLKNPDKVRETFLQAKKDALAYIEAIKSTGDSKFQDNEVIAGELLRRIKEKNIGGPNA